MRRSLDIPNIEPSLNFLPPHNAAKAVSHPLRAAILERLHDREASPVKLATEMHKSLPNVGYHVRALHRQVFEEPALDRLASHQEETVLIVEGISFDKVSDIATNV